MRQVNAAQQCANVIASVRVRAMVVCNNADMLLKHLLHALLGTSSKPEGIIKSSEIYSWPRGWFTSHRTQTVPVTITRTSMSTRDRNR